MIYEYIKIVHIIAIICWMAGLFYLPRLFVYHVEEAHTYKAEPLFLKMQDKLYRFIMMPSLIISYLSGSYLVYITESLKSGWFHIKLTAVILLTIYHFYLRHCHKSLQRGCCQLTGKYFRILNEVPTILLIIIIIVVVLKHSFLI